MGRRVTINDVAHAAGVSRQTVTRAHNNTGYITEETRRRVLEASVRLGYRPNRNARNLVARQKTYSAGLLVASFRNPYFTEIAGELLDGAARRGWQVMMASPESGGEASALELLAPAVDVFVGHVELPDDELLAATRGIPVIMLDRPSTRRGLHSVEIDLRSGVQEAVEALRAKGCRRLAMIDSTYSVRTSRIYVPSPRRRFFEEFTTGELPPIVAGEESMAGGALAFRALLGERPDVDAVLMFNDLMAIGAVQAAQALGIDVPGRVRILGVDGLSLGAAFHPALSTISLDRPALVARALDIADALAATGFTDRDEPICHTVLPQLVWRESA